MSQAQTLTSEIEFDGSTVLNVHYLIDHEFDDVVTIRLPRPFSLSSLEVSTIGLFTSFVLAKLCLASEIVLKFPCTTDMLESSVPILELLYDVRCFRDGIPILPSPRIVLADQRKALPAQRKKDNVTRRTSLIWSGGKDSTLSLLLLKANNYEVFPVHFTANYDTVAQEFAAVEALSKALKTPVEVLEFTSDKFVEIGMAYSPTFGLFPKYNSIPHGRDFILAAVLASMGQHTGSRLMCSGSEYELYSKTVDYCGKVVYRHDSQSSRGYKLFTSYLRKIYDPNFLFFSAVAPLTEYRSFRILLDSAPHLFQSLSSCFWGAWCGQCFKCFRYSLMQAALQNEVIAFRANPLQESPFMDIYLESWSTDTLPYWHGIHYCLSTLCQFPESIRQYPKLQRYQQLVLPYLMNQLDDMKTYLNKTHSVSLLPKDFNPSLLG